MGVCLSTNHHHGNMSTDPFITPLGRPPLPPPPLSQPEEWTVGRWRTSSLNWTFSFRPGVALVTAAHQHLNYVTCSFSKQLKNFFFTEHNSWLDSKVPA